MIRNINKFLFGGLAGWILMALFSVLQYSGIANYSCYFLTSWPFCAPLDDIKLFLRLLLLTAIYGIFIYYAWLAFKQEEGYKINRLLYILPITLAILTIPSQDTMYYYSLAKSISSGINAYVETWQFANPFSYPPYTLPQTGVMYGPLFLLLIKTIYKIGSSPLAFFIIFKTLLAGFYIYLAFLIQKILNLLNIERNKTFLFAFWLTQPLLLYELIANAHFDAFWIIFLLLAVFNAIKDKWLYAFSFLFISIWIKFIPLILLPIFLIWFWQNTTKNNYLKRAGVFFFGSAAAAAITVLSWQPYWAGMKVFDPIALQTKWVANSFYGIIYYGLRPFINFFQSDPHFFTALFSYGLTFGLVLIFSYPILKDFVRIIFKRLQWENKKYIEAIFFLMLFYSFVWQKSFWPWYITWLMPFALIIYLQHKNAILNKAIKSLFIMPLAFYPVWFLFSANPPEQFFRIFLFTAIMLYPLSVSAYYVWTNFGQPNDFEKKIFNLIPGNNKLILVAEKIKNIIFPDPLGFILRLIYKIIFAHPYFIAAYFIFALINLLPKKAPKDDIIFFITSVIYFKEKKLCYSDNRSAFSPEQRASDTLKTITSIKSKVPNAKIALLEAGLKKDLPFDLSSKVDYYIYLGANPLIRLSVDSGNKSLGEAAMSALGTRKLSAQKFFKISGRYELNENFNLGNYAGEGIFLKRLRSDFASSRLYSFSGNFKTKWIRALVLGLPYFLINYPIENILIKFMPKKDIKAIGILGVSGVDAVRADNIINE